MGPFTFAGPFAFGGASLDPPPVVPESPDEAEPVAEPPSLVADFESDGDDEACSDDAVDFSPDSLLSAFFRDSEG